MKDFWQDYWKQLQTHFDAASYNAFVKPSRVELKDDTLNIISPNKATERWLRKNLAPMLKDTMQEQLGRPLPLSYHISDTPANGHMAEEKVAPTFTSTLTSARSKHNLQARFRFNNFIPGRANEIPLIAAKKIAQGALDDDQINPLFIYGSTGLGKTHLIHAIGNEYLKNFPERQVLYISSRIFLNEVVNAYRLGRQEQFKNRYQDLDLLIVDDIQYIGGDKVRTQEEFFFLFNMLHERNKSIVISCDRAPSQITDLPQRLTTRFNAGLPTHITPPEFELRADILRQKAKTRRIRLNDEVVEFIAEHIKSNVRELEGAINRVQAMAEFQQTEPTLTLCRKAIEDLIGHANAQLHPDAIKEKVANFYSIRTADLSSKKRNRSIVMPRQIAMYLCRQMTNLSLPEIGKHFGKRNHTTVLHSCRQIEEKIKNNPGLWDEIKQLQISIKD